METNPKPIYEQSSENNSENKFHVIFLLVIQIQICTNTATNTNTDTDDYKNGSPKSITLKPLIWGTHNANHGMEANWWRSI